MTETTTRQIEAMKQQTIGVEVEMNNITREKAARTAARFFGTDRYENTAHRNGYQTWSAWDEQGREWKFQKDVSIAGPDAEKCEMVTPILHYEDIETLQELVRQMRHAGGKSCPSRGCGVHIHIGLGNHTPQSLRNLCNIMAAHETQIGRAIRLDSYRQSRYCRTIDPDFLARINKKKPTSFEAFKRLWYNGHDGSHQHYDSSRYHMTNLHACWTHGTIEFRCFQFAEEGSGRKGGLHAGELKAYIQLCLAISQLAKQVRFASPKPQQTENEAYAFRCWMLRLGFIGDEFKTARTILMRNMEGNCAWRNA